MVGFETDVTWARYRGSVRRVALAGGIGAGKSAVGGYLASRGYLVVDADDMARRVVEPGRPAYAALRDAFGDAVLKTDRTIDRSFLAEVVFHDTTALRRLNAITHEAIGREIVSVLEASDAPVAFVALPLFRPEHRKMFSLDEVWAILSDPEIALERLTRLRGMSRDDATSRLKVQVTNDERAAAADVVIWNNGSLDELFSAVDELLVERGLT